MLQGKVVHANPGIYLFDVDQPLSIEEAIQFKESYDGVLRYVPRNDSDLRGNLTESEGNGILQAGLSLMTVQHVESGLWFPNGLLGAAYGQFAAQYLKNVVGMPTGPITWLDLESVSTTASTQEVIDYCTEWFNAVQSAGYTSGLYVGWQPGLNGQQLYDLPFKHYWRAYNADFTPEPRGYQLIQHTQKTLNGIAFDPSVTQNDELGDSIIWLAPE